MRPCPVVSVIIPALNNSDLSSQIIQDILRTADLPPEDYEIIFVDDGSTDDTEQIIKQYAKVQYIKHPENRGVSPAWNTGIKAAIGDYCIIINNDVRITDNEWMSKTVNALSHSKCIVGVELVDFNAASLYKGKNAPYLNGWYYAFPRRIFSEIGLFDESFAPASYEDLEYCTRATMHGYKLKTINLRMQHAYSKTVAKYISRERMVNLNARNREIWLNKMDEMDKPALKIVFDAANNMEDIGGWGPTSLEDKGLGGAETAFTLLTRELASRGHHVLVFNAIREPAMTEDVYYYPRKMLPELGLDSDVFIAFRAPSEYLQSSKARQKIFWSCDQSTSGDWSRDIFPHVDEVVCISDYHRDFMKSHFGIKLTVVPRVIGCPVRHWDYEPHADKDENQFIFCSVPHRGLAYMPTVMREIRKALPEAKLTITSDYRLWGAPDPRNDEFKPLLAAENFLGMVSRADLVQIQNKSMAYPYPCTYLECFCIAVAECAAAGAIPITTDIGAVKQTVGDSGYIVGPPDGSFAQQVAAKTLEVYGKPELMRKAIEESWKWSVVNIGTQWEDLMYSGLNLPKEESHHEPVYTVTVLPSGDILNNRPSS